MASEDLADWRAINPNPRLALLIIGVGTGVYALATVVILAAILGQWLALVAALVGLTVIVVVLWRWTVA